MSYRSIADQIGMTANAVKKRIEGMIEKGTIVKFVLMPTIEMVGLTFFFGIVETKGTEAPLDFMDQLGESGIVAHVSHLAYGNQGGYGIFGHYSTSHALSEALSNIRRMDCVTNIEFHNAITTEGNIIEISNLQKRIIRTIMNDPRMSISDIAQKAGLSARRVRRELDVLIESGAFHFGVRWNLAREGHTQVLTYTEYSRDFEVNEYIQWIYETFELEAWTVAPSAMEPIIVTQFVTESLVKIPGIINELRRYPGVLSIRDYVVYLTKKYPWPAELLMKDIIS